MIVHTKRCVGFFVGFLSGINDVSTLLRERAIVELFLDSGIRLEELSSLQIPNVDLVNCWLKVLAKVAKRDLLTSARSQLLRCFCLFSIVE